MSANQTHSLTGDWYCNAKHPVRPDVFCRRIADHPGDHTAFVFSIDKPESWPAS